MSYLTESEKIRRWCAVNKVDGSLPITRVKSLDGLCLSCVKLPKDELLCDGSRLLFDEEKSNRCGFPVLTHGFCDKFLVTKQDVVTKRAYFKAGLKVSEIDKYALQYKAEPLLVTENSDFLICIEGSDIPILSYMPLNEQVIDFCKLFVYSAVTSNIDVIYISLIDIARFMEQSKETFKVLLSLTRPRVLILQGVGEVKISGTIIEYVKQACIERSASNLHTIYLGRVPAELAELGTWEKADIG